MTTEVLVEGWIRTGLKLFLLVVAGKGNGIVAREEICHLIFRVQLDFLLFFSFHYFCPILLNWFDSIVFAIIFSGASMILAALAMEAGLPDGVLNIVHGPHV